MSDEANKMKLNELIMNDIHKAETGILMVCHDIIENELKKRKALYILLEIKSKKVKS